MNDKEHVEDSFVLMAVCEYVLEISLSTTLDVQIVINLQLRGN